MLVWGQADLTRLETILNPACTGVQQDTRDLCCTEFCGSRVSRFVVVVVVVEGCDTIRCVNGGSVKEVCSLVTDIFPDPVPIPKP